MGEKKRFFRNTFLVSISSFWEKLVFFIITIIVARYLDKTSYGEYTTAIEFGSFIAVFTDLGISRGIIRAVGLDPENRASHLGNSLVLRTLLAAGVYLCFCLFLPFFGYGPVLVSLILVFALVRIGNEYMIGFYSVYEAGERFMFPAAGMIAFPALLLAATGIVVMYGGDYFHLAYSRLVLVAGFLVFISIHTRRRFSCRFSPGLMRGFIADTLPFSLDLLFSNIINRIYIIIVSLYLGAVYAGVFNNAFLFVVTLSIIPINFNKVLVPFLYRKSLSGDNEVFGFTFDFFSRLFAFLSLYLFMMFYLFADIIISTVFGSRYHASVQLLQILSFSIPVIFNLPRIIITAMDRQAVNTRIAGAGAFAGIIAALLLVKYYGIQGAALSVDVTFFIIFMISHIYMVSRTPLKAGRAILYYIVFSGIAGVCMWLYFSFPGPVPWIWGGMIVTLIYLFLSLIFLLRRNDLRILKEIFLSR